MSPIGAGGMGEVYRARDTRLDRTVAIKVLSASLHATSEVRARFEREARTISQLQHPHICTLHDVGRHEGTDFLVMEYLEGETLADRIRRGVLPLDQVLKIGSEIADALDKAHHAGIAHRDLKPGNIMLTKAGAKLLDFGLAKPLAAIASTAGSAPLLSAAVTLTSPSPAHSPLTSAGMIVGTIQYMAPEQIEGKEADTRSDIFAFGAVLYEMATGKRAFEGKSQLTVASAILEKDPEPVSTVRTAAAALEPVLRGCLAKDPHERIESAHDVALQLRWIAQTVASTPAISVPTAAAPKRLWLAGAAGLVLFAAVGGYWLGARDRSASMHVQIPPPDKFVFDATGDYGGVPVISPQGDRVAFSAHSPNSTKALWVRPLNSFVAQRLEGTEGAGHPFWSPDGRYLGFFANGKVNKVLAAGGPVTALAIAENPRGGTWCSSDVILFAPNFQGPLSQVSASGGAAKQATSVDTSRHSTHRWPACLPDGKHFLYLATQHQGGRADENGIYFGALDGQDTRLVVASDSSGQYASGYLLFHAQASLMAQPFNPRSGALSGEAVALLDKVKYDSGVWRTAFSASDTGILGYLPGASGVSGTDLVWFDRKGNTQGLAGQRGTYSDPRISPDGKRLAFVAGDPIWDVWVMDLERGSRTRVTFDQSVKAQPAWSPDGKQLAFSVTKPSSGGAFAVIHAKAANGSGGDRTLVEEPGNGTVNPEFSPDGKHLVYLRRTNSRGVGIYAKLLEGNAAPFAVVAAADPQSSLGAFRISPNGRWIAYESTESGRNEVYIAPFPNGDGKWQVSNSGGNFPCWRADGKEIFFYSPNDEAFAATVGESAGELKVGTPQLLFHTNASAVGIPYDAARDGQRFLVNRAEDESIAPLHLITNWTAELKKK